MTLEGHELSYRDRCRVANAVIMYSLVLQDILIGSRYERAVSEASLTSWLRRLVRVDLSIWSDQLKRTLALLRSNPSSRSSFKRLIKLERLSPDILGPAYLSCLLYFDKMDCFAFQDANTALQFPVRLTLKDIDFVEEKQYSAYLDFEEQLKLQRYPEDLLSDMRSVMNDWFRSWRDEDIIPHHGNGATAEVRRSSGIQKKYLAYWNGRTTADEWFCQSYDWQAPKAAETVPSVAVSPSDLHVVLQCVPKGIDKKRLISMEPTTHQYFVEGVAASLDSLFKRRPEIRVDLHDQGWSRRLALLGSYDGDYCTVDLSNASDSVTLSLVKEVFRDTPVYPYLLMFRTPWVDMPNGDTIKLEKYAPMGSALCFPIECLIFSCVVAVANKRLGIHTNYRVYGDDIVIRSQVYDLVLSLLSQLHFEVNETKTFGPGHLFKEACGIECLRGDDVSPCRISRKWDIVQLRERDRNKRIVHPTMLSGAIDLCNRLYSYGFISCRRYVLWSLREVYPYVPFGSPNGIASDNCDNHHLRRRWNQDYQRWERFGQFVVSKPQPGDDEWRYLVTIQSDSFRTRERLLFPEDAVEIGVGPTRCSVRSFWFPEEISSSTFS